MRAIVTQVKTNEAIMAKAVRVSAYLANDHHQQLLEIAAKEKRSVSQVIGLLLEEALDARASLQQPLK